MAKGKNTRPNGVDREAHQEAVPAADLSKEPTIQDWHALLNAILEHEDEIQLTVQFLLLGSPSGRAFLEYITEYRPKIVDGPIFDFLELVTTYETLGLLEVLKAEPRFGVDPEFFIWREFWDDSSRGPSYAYKDLIELSTVMEAKVAKEEERLRIRFVREAIERELQGEEYLERRKSLLGKMREPR